MRRGRLLLVFALLGGIAPASLAHELDHFSLPVDRPFADLSDYITEVYYDNLAAAVKRLNRKIERAQKRGASAEDLEKLRDPSRVVDAFIAEFPPVVIYIEDLESIVKSGKLEKRYPGRIISWRPSPSVFDETHFPLDTKSFFLLWRSSLIKVNGVFLGTDKFGHFLHNGHNYFNAYRRVIDRGGSEADAVQSAIEVGSGNNFLLSEKYALGKLTSGVVSNADLAANFLGLQLLRNLTEPIRLNGVTRPPLLNVVDEKFELASHVQRNSNFLMVFFTDHFDEVLNPNQYDALVEAAMKKALRRRRATVLSFYCDANGEPLTASYFRAKQKELRTISGTKYGYIEHRRGMFSFVDTIWPVVKTAEDQQALLLLQAAEAGDASRVRKLLRQGIPANATLTTENLLPAEKGATALHYAVANGHASVVRALLAARADANARTANGVTPLHKAAAESETIGALLRAGANVNAMDASGRTPLHWAARYDDAQAVRMFAGRGADANAADNGDNTPLHDAAYVGAIDAIRALAASGADASRRARYGLTPLHAAVLGNQPAAIRQLLRSGRSSTNMRDDLGRTPIALAESLGCDACLAALRGRSFTRRN